MKFKKTLLLAALSICTFLSISLINSTGSQTPLVRGNQDIHVILDMHGVLVRTKPQKGIKKLFAALLTKGIKRKLFTLLDGIEPRNPEEAQTCDEYGNLLPQIMCNWLKGTETPEQLIAKVDACGKSGMVPDIARSIFDPEQFAKKIEWIDESIEFVTDLKEQGYKLHILSNWDPASFKIMKAQYPEIFNLFDGIMISGDVGKIKPDNTIYEHILAQHGINRACACFIDDQPCNVDAGNNAGIYSIQCLQKNSALESRPNIHSVCDEFYAWQEGLKNPAPRAA